MTFFNWIRFQWWWFTSYRTRELRDKMCMWIAFNLPKSVAKWAFIRVYTFGQRNTPSYEASLVMTAWDFQEVPAPGCFDETPPRVAIQLGPLSDYEQALRDTYACKTDC